MELADLNSLWLFLSGLGAKAVYDYFVSARAHRHEIRKRFYEVRLNTAERMARLQHQMSMVFKARLKAEEELCNWEGEITPGMWQTLRQSHQDEFERLSREMKESYNANAMLELVFPYSVLKHLPDSQLVEKLQRDWLKYDAAMSELTANVPPATETDDVRVMVADIHALRDHIVEGHRRLREKHLDAIGAFTRHLERQTALFIRAMQHDLNPLTVPERVGLFFSRVMARVGLAPD